MRPEFDLLATHFRMLYAGVDLNQELLRQIRVHLRLCEHIAESDKERAIIARVRQWWKSRAEGLDLTDTPFESRRAERGYTSNDRRFLRSLKIAADEDEAVE